MKSTRRILLPFFLFLSLSISHAQQGPDFICGFDDLRSPTKQAGIQEFEEQLRLHIAQKGLFEDAPKGLSGPPYIIPVVVHIIHDGGVENIPDAQILAAIDHLNEGFTAQGYFAQQGATVNTQIQFCMAKRDPDGNATTGITRNQSPLTNMIMETEDIQTKNINRWNPKDYVNIWVVKEISSQSLGSGVAGYAYFPSSHGSPEDGMICEARYFGTSAADDGVLIHEMGHYFGLYHTFEGGCPNNNCTIDGDKVCDTPPDNATHTTCPFNSCSTDIATGSPFLADVDDFTGDFMDYSPFSCYHFFTQGQATRMQGAVETARASLLESKACLDPCNQPIVASFSAIPNPVLAGQTVVFTNNSSGATNFSWSEDGLEFSQNQDVSKVFNTAGQFSILLTASNTDPNCQSSAFTNIVVECPLVVLFSSAAPSAMVGETVFFTNLTTGAPPINYEWSVNGQLVSTNQDLSFLFQNSGIYSVTLKAIGSFCTKEYAIIFTVNKHCGQTESNSYSYTAPIKSFFTNDLATIPDGTLLHCGTHQLRPAVTRWDAAGNVIWHKVTTDKGGFWEIEPLPSGQFLLIGGAEDKLLVAKIDINGNFIWYKKLNFPNNSPNGKATDVSAANPDGSFGLFAVDGNNALLLKIAVDGTVLWSKRLDNVSRIGGLRIATDGTGDFLLSATGSFGTQGSRISVLRFSQSGQFVKAIKYSFPSENFMGFSYEDLSVHPEDGGYSIFFTGFLPTAFSVGYKRLVHCAADGSVLWAKRFETSGGLLSMYAIFRHLPDAKGWLVTDYKSNANQVSQGNYLMHISNEGEQLWQRKYGTGGLFNESIVATEMQNGLVKAVWEAPDNSELRLLSLPDSDFPLACFPDLPLTDITFPMTVLTENVIIQTTDFNVTLDDAPLVLANDVLTATPLCSEVLPCAEVCDNGLDDDEDGYVDCFDSDCDCFTPYSACNVLPSSMPLAGKIAWESAKDLLDMVTVPIVGNLNPQVDTIPEIIVYSREKADHSLEILIFKGDGSNRLNPAKFAPLKLNTIEEMPPLLIDINKDGIPELLVPTWDGNISVYTNYQENQTPALSFWFESTTGSNQRASMLNSADFDQDGIPEIFMGSKIYKFDFTNPAAPTLTLVLTGTGHAGRRNPWSAGFLDVSAAADILSKSDCNGDPDCDGLELAAGAHIYSIDLDPNDGDGLQIKIQRNLNQLAPGNVYMDGFTQIADMNLDGNPDVVVNSARSSGNTIVDGCYVWDKNGLITYFRAYPTTNWKSEGKLTIANVFDDRKAGFAQDFPEIIRKMGDSMCIVAFNLHAQTLNPVKPFWWKVPNDDISNVTFLSAFDFNRDGLDDLVSKGDSSLSVYYGGNAPFPPGVNPATRIWFEIAHVAGTKFDGPIVADTDNDGDAEILYGINGNGIYAQLRVLESASLPWPQARPLWNQYSYSPLAINDDLSVPKNQQKHWLEMGGIGSGQRPFNNHLTQISSLDPFNSNRLKVPDADIALDSTRCSTDSFEVYLTLCNMGEAPLPDSTPVTFYIGDPTSTAAPILFTRLLVHENLEVGACTQIHLNIPANFNAAIFAVINDDGTLPPPFNLTTNFPATNQPECQYANNMVSFSIQNQMPTLDLGPDISLCENSVIELTANPNFIKYRWQNGSTGSKFTAYTPGKYWVDAFDACGFRQTDTINVVLNTIQALNLPDVLTACEGEEISLFASGFSKYTWSPADSVSCSDCSSVNIVASNSITIQLTAAAGDCFVTDSVHINVNPKPSLQLLTQDGDCGTPASITTIAVGDGPFDFLWSNLSIESVLSISQSGTYTVSITDQNGCQTSDSAAVIVTNSLAILANSTMPNCSNTQTGSIDLTVNNGTAPFQFLWSNNATTEDLSNTSAGTYSVLTTDANGCTATITETLSDPSAIVLDLQKTEPKCAGENSGALDLSASGGTGTLFFSWSNNSSLEDLNNLSSGIYSLLTTDANGCTATISDTLSDPPALVLGLHKTDPKCAGEASGAIDLSASGGTGALLFLWSNNSSLEDLNNLSSGVYSVLTTDANGCTATILETLSDPPALILGLQKTDPKCTGESSGTLDLTASGGTGILLFLWSNNSSLEDLNNLSSGVYNVLTTDANGCTAMLSETLTEPPALVLDLQKTEPKCAGEASGRLDLMASGGTGILLFSWSNNSNFEDLNNLPSGVYSVLTTDANGCTATISETLTDPPAMVLNFQKTDLNCPGDLGTIDLTAAGGLSPYIFQWSNGETTEDINISQPGTYTASVKDANGCTFSESILVSILGAVPILNLTTDTLTCQKTSGVISATSDLPNTSFLWTGTGGFSAQISSPTISTYGTYSVIATDPLGGCSTVASVFVSLDTTAPTILLASHYFEIPCDQNSSSISAAGSSSGPDFSIQWTATSGGLILSGDQTLFPVVGGSGFFNILIADLSNGCTASDAVEVFQMDSPTGIVTADSVRCFGEMNGAIQVVSNVGGIPPFMYSIDNQNFKADPVFENLAAGLYQVFIRDANDCAFMSQIEIGQPVPIAVELTGDSLVVPGVPANLQAIVHPPNMVPTQIEWSANGVDLALHQLQQSVQLLQNTLFQINIVDENGCSASDTWLVEVEESRKIYVPNVIYPASSGGTNQTFLIFTGLSVREIESLDIFDRWGNQLYSNRNFKPNDESQGWNGTFRGQLVEPGVFVWVAKVVFKDGTVEVLKGDLTVIR